MHNIKLISVLKSFSKIERNRLKKFVMSPYFNSSDAIVRLFEIIEADLALKQSSLDRETIWQQIFPDKPYDDVRFRKLVSDLLKLVEEFLSTETYQSNPVYASNFLMSAILSKKLYKLFNESIRKAKDLVEQRGDMSPDKYYYDYSIEKNVFELEMNNPDLVRTQLPKIEKIVSNLDKFFIAEKLKYLCYVLDNKTFIEYNQKILFIDEILKNLKEISYIQDPPIHVYYLIYEILLAGEDDEKFDSLIEYIEKVYESFEVEETYEVFIYALNYCNRRINAGKREFLNKLFNLYRFLLDKEIITRNGELDPLHFKNIVLTGLRVKEFKWVEKFIEDYQGRIPAQYRENAITFNLAQLFFYKKDFKKVIELLQNVEFEDFVYNFNSKTILMIVYYELDEVEALYSLMESFRTYINRQTKLSEVYRTGYLNLIKYVKKLLNVKTGSTQQVSRLREEILQTRNISTVNWLLEKLDELE